MNELSRYLVEQILLEESTPIKKTVVIYAGRFQPFHKGHYATYSHLVSKFGKDNVFIGTSDKVEKPKSPFNFKEKKQIMTTMFGVPSNKIYEVKNPYAPTEILKKFDEKTTAFVTVVGQKDASRLGGKYFAKWDGKPTEGYNDKGYVYVAPEGGGGVSGTEVRIGLGSGSEEQKKNFFVDRAYSKFNKTIFNLITNKLQESCIRLSKTQLEDLLIEVSSGFGQDMVDDGPVIFLPDYNSFKVINGERAQQIGWEIINMVMDDSMDDYITYPEGPTGRVTFFPRGAIGKKDPMGEFDVMVNGAYDKWYKHVTRTASLVGYSVVDKALNVDDKLSTQLAKGARELSKESDKKVVKESITLPVEIGDTLLMGKFKNKKVVVKSIGKDEHGMPTINGKKVVTFRLVKEGKQVFFEGDKEDEKYTHIGYGRYKEKGKEKDSSAPIFKKDDSGKYTPIESGDSTPENKPKQNIFSKDSGYKDSLPSSDPAKKQQPKSGVNTFQGAKSGKEIQTTELEGGGQVFGTVHGNTKMVDDILDKVKSTIPQDRWKDVVFVGEGGMGNDNGELEFGGEMDYAAKKFQKIGAGVDTWDGDETSVFDNESPLYKYQEQETGLSNEEVMAANWASMIGQGDSVEDMSPEDYLTDTGKELLKQSAQEANLPLSNTWDSNPTEEDVDTLYRLSFADDYGDKKTKVNAAQESFNKFRDVNLLRKTKELSSQGKIPIVLAGESHVELVDNMMKNEWMGSNPIMMESIAGTSIKCEICEHEWELEVKDEHPYLCHTCGWDSQQQEYDFAELEEWEDEESLDEALTQAQRAARRWSFAKNKKLINIKKQRTHIRKKPYSVLYKRAYKLAYLYVRKEWTQRLFGMTPYADLSLPKKKRVSQMVQKKKRKILKLAKFRFLPALKQKEADRFKTVHQYPSNLTFDTPTNEMSMSQLKGVEKYAEKQLSPQDIEFTQHFFDRVNDPRNGKPISDAELTGFFKRLSRIKNKFKEFLEKYKEIVVRDKRYDINIPFVKQANQAIAKTVMRKDDFKSSDPILSFESGDLIDEVNSGFYDGVRGSMTPNDAAGATGYMYNHSWEEYDTQEYYLGSLPGFELVHEVPSEFELGRAVDQGIPLMVHGDGGKTSKYNRILKADFKSPQEFMNTTKSIKKESKIPGGLSQGMSLSDIAKKHNISVSELMDEFKKGYKVEREHTTDTDIAKEIAMDHLFEDPKYYTKLKKIEETIQKIDNKWVVYGKAGGKKLGEHETYEEALKQLREIELDKFRKINKKIDELAPHGYPDQEWMDNHEKEMKKLRKQLDTIHKKTYGLKESVAKYVEPKRVETFLKKYPKVNDFMQKIVDKVKDDNRGYQIFLHYKEDKGLEKNWGGKKVEKSKDTINKRFASTSINRQRTKGGPAVYNYEYDGSVGSVSWPEVYQYLWNKKYQSVKESLLKEGGAYGHMNHPFDTEINLTFGQLKDIVNRALDGNLELAREKTDGQALAISWVGGRLVAARNKGHLKNKGAGALDIKGVADKFSGRGELEKAYNFAMKDLTDAIKSLSDAQRFKIFKDGACFMNLEVIYPTSVNVIPYGQPLLVFHGTMEYDDEGNAIGENQGAAKILAGMIKQVNKDVQDNYTIQGPPVLSLPKSQDLSSKKGKYTAKISKLQKEFGLKDTDGVAEYHQAWWNDYINKKSPSMLDNKTKMGLVKRWAFGDKGFRIDSKNITDEKVLNWALTTDKEDQAKITKQNLMKFEDIFLGVGAEVLQFTSSVLTVNPDAAIRDMKKRLDQTIKEVEKSGDPKKIEKLKLELRRLQAIGGPSKIVPNEGIVFTYQGKTFKLTGAFASLNQILGIFYA